MENTSAAIATIPAIIRKSKHRDCNNRKDHRGLAISTIIKIAEVLRSQRSQRFYGNQSSAIVTIAVILTIVNDYMETESGLYFGKGTEKFHYVFTFRFRNYFLGANVPPEIISLDALVEMEIFAKINFIKQG